MSTTTLRSNFVSPRTPVKRITSDVWSIWTVLSRSLEMAHIVGDVGSVSRRQLEQVRAVAERL